MGMSENIERFKHIRPAPSKSTENPEAVHRKSLSEPDAEASGGARASRDLSPTRKRRVAPEHRAI